MRSFPVVANRSISRRWNRPRSSFHNRYKRRKACPPALLLDVFSNQDMLVGECPEELEWLPVSIRQIFTAFGISKNADPLDVANAAMEKIKNPIKPVLDLLARGVKEISFFVRDAALCVKVVWDRTTELVLYGPTQHFFAVLPSS